MSHYELAQVNIAKLRKTLESPSMADFVKNLDRINALAEEAPGFVWRLEDEDESADAIRPFGNDYVVNMSVWKDVASLSHYAFESGHADIMRRRREWFQPMTEAHAAGPTPHPTSRTTRARCSRAMHTRTSKRIEEHQREPESYASLYTGGVGSHNWCRHHYFVSNPSTPINYLK
jgi:hypothetical protein